MSNFDKKIISLELGHEKKRTGFFEGDGNVH